MPEWETVKKRRRRAGWGHRIQGGENTFGDEGSLCLGENNTPMARGRCKRDENETGRGIGTGSERARGGDTIYRQERGTAGSDTVPVEGRNHAR